MQKSHSNINYYAEWITSSSTTVIFQRKSLIPHLRDWVTALRPHCLPFSDPVLLHPSHNCYVFQKGASSLLGFKTVSCTTWLTLQEQNLLSAGHLEPKGEFLRDCRLPGNICSYQQGGEYKSMCTPRAWRGVRPISYCLHAVIPTPTFLLHAPASSKGQTGEASHLLCSQDTAFFSSVDAVTVAGCGKLT